MDVEYPEVVVDPDRSTWQRIWPWARPLNIVVLSIVVGWIVVGFIGAIDWAAWPRCGLSVLGPMSSRRSTSSGRS